jgi:acetyl-CoA carboxylase beta subunit
MSTEALENENISSRQNQEEMFATCTQEMTRELVYANDLAKNFDHCRSDTNYVNKRLRILHFNDVYNIEESKDEPKAGASRFSTALKMFQREEPCLVLFSGDAFSPSSCNF